MPSLDEMKMLPIVHYDRARPKRGISALRFLVSDSPNTYVFSNPSPNSTSTAVIACDIGQTLNPELKF